MTTFDVRTAYLIVALLYVALPAFTWIVLAPQRRQAVGLWCGGGLITGGAFLLLGAQGTPSNLYSHALANLFLVFGFLTRIQALRLDLGIAWRRDRVILAALAFVGVYEVLLQLSPNEGFRVGVVSLSYVVRIWLIFYLVGLAWRISIVEKSPSAGWIARAYFVVGIAVLLRQLHVMTGASGQDVAAPGIDMLFVSLSFVLASVVGHIGYVGLALDRSMRREIDTATTLARDEVSRRLGGKIAHLDRQRSLGTMAASLGHELNQPLTAILISAQVARRGILAERFDAAQVTEFLDKIVASTQRASQIIERIRGFIRPTAELREPVDLFKALAEVRALVADEVKTRSVSFFMPTVPAHILVQGDPVQLSQVILNVVRNALDALADTPRREIHVSLHQLQDRAVLRIRDTGPGLRPDLLAQVGTPFFTTKSTGLGMGLSIAKSIVEQFAGTLAIRNADDGGTLVELNFPVLEARRVPVSEEMQ